MHKTSVLCSLLKNMRSGLRIFCCWMKRPPFLGGAVGGSWNSTHQLSGEAWLGVNASWDLGRKLELPFEYVDVEKRPGFQFKDWPTINRWHCLTWLRFPAVQLKPWSDSKKVATLRWWEGEKRWSPDRGDPNQQHQLRSSKVSSVKRDVSCFLVFSGKSILISCALAFVYHHNLVMPKLRNFRLLGNGQLSTWIKSLSSVQKIFVGKVLTGKRAPKRILFKVQICWESPERAKKLTPVWRVLTS